MLTKPIEEKLTERREAPRVDLEGQFSVRLDPCDGRDALTCPVLDYSVTGMRLSVPAATALPRDVHIVIGKLSHNGRVVWRKDDIIGIDLIDEHHSLY